MAPRNLTLNLNVAVFGFSLHRKRCQHTLRVVEDAELSVSVFTTRLLFQKGHISLRLCGHLADSCQSHLLRLSYNYYCVTAALTTLPAPTT